jgi:DNA invertase Pin-like site-specific DNA recombinase
MTKAIIYARVSSVTDRQNTDRQVNDLSSYAEANNIEVVKVFAEHISGGKRNADRPVLMQALEFAKLNAIDIVLLSELSRLGRSVYELQEIIKDLRDNKINAFFQKEGITLFNADGSENVITPILVTVLGVCAQIERENIKFRLNSGRKNAINRGVRMGRKEGSKKSVEAKENEYAEVIKRLRKGDKMTDIAAWCRGKGIKCSLSTIKRLKKEFIS